MKVIVVEVIAIAVLLLIDNICKNVLIDLTLSRFRIGLMIILLY